MSMQNLLETMVLDGSLSPEIDRSRDRRDEAPPKLKLVAGDKEYVNLTRIVVDCRGITVHGEDGKERRLHYGQIEILPDV